MEPDVAAEEAVESMQAAPVAGAGSEKEREKSALLSRMETVESPETGLEPETEEETVSPEEEVREAQDAEREAARAEARKALEREFPEALTPGSELSEACREELEYLREAQSPLADDPQAEYKIARRMARLLGAGQRSAPEPQKSAPRRKVRPVPAGNVPAEPPATTLERRVAGAKSTGEMLDLMREIGTPFEALLRR